MKCAICNKRIWWWQKSKQLLEEIARHWYGVPRKMTDEERADFIPKLRELWLSCDHAEPGPDIVYIPNEPIPLKPYHLKCLNEKVCGEI